MILLLMHLLYKIYYYKLTIDIRNIDTTNKQILYIYTHTHIQKVNVLKCRLYFQKSKKNKNKNKKKIQRQQQHTFLHLNRLKQATCCELIDTIKMWWFWMGGVGGQEKDREEAETKLIFHIELIRKNLTSCLQVHAMFYIDKYRQFFFQCED